MPLNPNGEIPGAAWLRCPTCRRIGDAPGEGPDCDCPPALLEEV